MNPQALAKLSMNTSTTTEFQTSIQWSDLREPFDRPLARARAIHLRGGQQDLSMLCISSQREHGYAWQGTTRRIDSFDPDFFFRISEWFPGTPNPRPMRDFPQFLRNRFGPDIIERELEYPSLSVNVSEQFFRTVDADYVWHSIWSRNVFIRDCKLRVQLEIEGAAPFDWNWSASKDVAILSLQVKRAGELPLHLAIENPGGNAVTCEQRSERSIVLTIGMDIGSLDAKTLRMTMSCRSAQAAVALVDETAVQEALKAVASDWNTYFSHFHCPKVPLAGRLTDQLSGKASRAPNPHYLDSQGRQCPQVASPPVDSQEDLTGEDVRFAYFKGLWHSRAAERDDPRLGASLTESITCNHNGTFTWSLPVAGFYAHDQVDPAGQRRVRNSLEGYRQNQAPDGWLPCCVPFNYKPNPNRKASPSTQIPQYAWTVWQDFLFDEDCAWLASWYEPLCRYYQFMRKRDAAHLNLGLWCQIHYYDGLDVFPTSDGLYLRGEPCLYSAVYAAEQIRFGRVLAKIAEKVDPGQAARFSQEADFAQTRMEEVLWDPAAQWYGDVLADGGRETIVGMSGLFAAAYGFLPAGSDKRVVRENLESLITPYGVATVAPRERRYTERFFWRGPVWPASCLYGAAAALRYAPDLLPRIAAATVRLAKAQPNVWECVEPHSGKIASYEPGVATMPGMGISVVGATSIYATLRICAGEDLFSLDSLPPKRPVRA
jgi:hypothetical protein